jgi:hypothetical protein
MSVLAQRGMSGSGSSSRGAHSHTLTPVVGDDASPDDNNPAIVVSLLLVVLAARVAAAADVGRSPVVPAGPGRGCSAGETVVAVSTYVLLHPEALNIFFPFVGDKGSVSAFFHTRTPRKPQITEVPTRTRDEALTLVH